MPDVVRCPICNKLISLRFPIHECKQTKFEGRKVKVKAVSTNE